MHGKPKQLRGITRARSDRHTGWQAQIKTKGHKITWGPRLQNPEDAARIYDVMAIYLRPPGQRPEARINFDGRPPAWLPRPIIRAFLVKKGVLPACYRDKEPPRFSRLEVDSP